MNFSRGIEIKKPGELGSFGLCSGVHVRCNHALLLVHSWTEALLPAGLGRSRCLNLKDNSSGDEALFVDDPGCCPRVQNTDPVGSTEPLWGDKAATHPVGQCVSALLPAGTPKISDGDQEEPLLALEQETWLCLPAAAVVQLISLMLE